MAAFPINNFDIIYLSYDEPQAEEFWADLSTKCPWAKRVDKVKGFDAAHRACADLSETDFFITVDGDNKVDEQFFELEIEFDEIKQCDWAWSWDGKNYVNGLVYGNGGLKLWSKAFVYNMHSHENSTETKYAVDFCWNKKYSAFKGCYSTTYTNATPFQAFRAGFREGVKMCLDQGLPLTADDFKKKVYFANMQRLVGWCSVGADVENGLWSIYGARLGAKNTLLLKHDHTAIRDYDWFNQFWLDVSQNFIGDNHYPQERCMYSNYRWNKELLVDAIDILGHELKADVNLPIANLNAEQSAFIKVYADGV